MNKRWIRIFKKAFGADAKEFLRNPLSPFFTMVMPALFLVIFGVMRFIQQKEGMVDPHGGMSQGDYFLYVMPAMLSLGLVNLSLFSTTMPLAYARHSGILRQYMLIPMPLSALLVAQVGVRLVMALIQGFIILAVAILAFNVAIKGNYLILFSAYIFCAAVMITCGYALAGLLNSLSVSTVVIMVLNFYVMGFGQIFSDLARVPYVKWLIYLTPVSSVSDLLRQICLGQMANLSIGANLAILSGWALAAYVAGIRKFRFLPE